MVSFKLDQSTFTVGEDSEVVMDTFIYDPKTNDGKIKFLAIQNANRNDFEIINYKIKKKIFLENTLIKFME